ncbi:MAG TPA: AAA family ATPase [Oscillospiraceae bacterium]|nr:AAA family ATPase [Oscillospiraceae bacterium]HPF55223.1 AAA family ATPase [Clostridiales bacterium]HPK36031.1 AAA family ATPase [Oscillospiraceae bacterium]
MKNGNIVILNGVTSAGKSTLSRALQAAFDEPYYYVALDTLNDVICPFTANRQKFQDPQIMNRAVPVMHMLIRDFSQKGLNVIVDHILCDGGDWFYDCVDALFEYPVMFVRVDCDRDELFKRAKKRGYKTPERLNQIDRQLAQMHKHGFYDVVISTSTNTTEENVQKIKTALLRQDEWRAFRQLKQMMEKTRCNGREICEYEK